MNLVWQSLHQPIPKVLLELNVNSPEALPVYILCQDQLQSVAEFSHSFYVWLSLEFNLNSENYKDLKKNGNFLGYIGDHLGEQELKNVLLSYQERKNKNLKQIEIIQKAKNQNLVIEDQVNYLNTQVEIKTQELYKSRDELEKKVSFEKDSILILKNLLEASSFESFSKIILNSFKDFKLQNIFLFQNSNNSNYKIESEVLTLAQANLSLGEVQALDKFKWANLTARPVVDFKVLGLGNDQKYFLGLEFYSFNFSQFNELQEHFRYLQFIFRMVLDFLMDKKKLVEESMLWSSSFKSLDDPILIIDEYFRIAKSNSNRFKETEHCFKALFGRTKPCDFCPILNAKHKSTDKDDFKNSTTAGDFELHSFPFEFNEESEQKLWIHHYESTESINELRAKYLKAEKFSYMGQLVDKVIHQIANPLTGMKSSLEFLLKSPEKYLKEDLEEIYIGVKRCFGIINNLKQFSSAQVDMSEVEISELVNNTLVLMKSVTRDIKIQTYNLEHHFIKCPVGLVQQVLFNIIYNACQAMEFKGTINLSLDQNSQSYLLVIADDGPGIPESLKTKVFDPFFTTKSKNEGTGIGLFLSQQIIRQFGGDVFIMNNLSPGAQLCISFPK